MALNRYSELKTYVPLKRKTPMKRTGIKKRRRTFKSKPRDEWGPKDYLDAGDSLFVVIFNHLEDSTCQHCGRTREQGWQIHVHHKIHRDRMFFRHNMNNGMCLCASCHETSVTFSAGKTPAIFDRWLIDERGTDESWYEKNRYVVVTGWKVNWEEDYEMLCEIAAKMGLAPTD